MYEFRLVYKVKNQIISAYVYTHTETRAKQWLREEVPDVTDIFRCERGNRVG